MMTILIINMIAIYTTLGLVVYHVIIRNGKDIGAVMERQDEILKSLDAVEKLTNELWVMHAVKDTDGSYIWHFKRGLNETLKNLQKAIDELRKQN